MFRRDVSSPVTALRRVLEEHLEEDDLPSGTDATVEWVLSRAAAEDGREGARDTADGRGSSGAVLEGGGVPDRIVETVEPYEAWTVLASVHEALDRAGRAGDLPPEDVVAVRRRIVAASRNLHTKYVAAELAVNREVLRDITHDIRSPLNSIMFLADALYGEQSGPLNEVQKRQLGIVYSAAASLLNFVNDLLDLSRGTSPAAGEIAEIPFTIDGALSDARRLIAPILQHKNTRLESEVETSGTYRGDPQVLTRVCINLLANAVEEADDGGTVSLRVRDTDEDRLVIEVANDGTGADVEHLQELVSGSDGEQNPVRTIRGRTHGLGLLICGRLVRAAGGHIEVDRDGERRTRFTVNLPFSEAGS